MKPTSRNHQLISRRGLLGSGAAASVLAAAGFSAASRPEQSGILRIAAPSGWIFDRLLAPGSACDCLTEFDGEGALRGELAETWEARDGGLEWLVTIREGAAFHDGRPVEASDVTSAIRRSNVGAIKNVRAMRTAGPSQIRFVLAAADPQFPMRLADPALAVSRRGKSDMLVGSGLYRVIGSEDGARVRLERTPDTSRATRGGWFDRLELLMAEAASERGSMLLDGRVDLAFGLPSESARDIARRRRLGTTMLRLEGPDGPEPVLAGHSVRLRGLDGRDPLRIAERGYFA